MFLTIRNKVCTNNNFGILFIATVAVSLTNDVLFHLGLIFILVFVALTPITKTTPKQNYLIFWLMVQYPIMLVVRRVIDWGIDLSFWENIIRWIVISSFLLWLPKKDLTLSTRVLGLASAMALIVSGMVAIYQVEILSLGRAGGTENPLNFGMFCVLFSAIVTYIMPSNRNVNRYIRLLYSISILLGIAAIVYSGSRGPFLTYLIVIPLALLLSFSKSIFTDKKWIYASFLISIILLGAVFTAQKTGLVDKTINELAYYEQTGHMNSSGARIEMWKFSIDAFLQKPIYGVGLDYRPMQMQDGKYLAYSNAITRYAHSHNEILEALSKYGLIGFLSIITIWFIPLITNLINFNRVQLVQRNLMWLVNGSWAISGLTQVHSHHTSGVTLWPLMFVMVTMTYIPLTNIKPRPKKVKAI